MNPAYSVIIFTTASGVGYGLLIWLALAHLFQSQELPTMPALIAVAIGLVLVTVGLLASTLHLGHPERAWRAFSQWRSSWLSREGVFAVLAYPLVFLFTASAIWGGLGARFSPAIGVLLILVCLLTVISTGMIYASLKAVPRWNNSLVAPLYGLFSLSSGGLVYGLVLSASGKNPGIAGLLVLFLLTWLCKWAYWRRIDNEVAISNTGTATGLGHLGQVSQLEAPHTSENYLLQEMGYQVARKHSVRLRRLALFAGLVAPCLLILLASIAAGFGATLLWLLAVASGMTGLLVERWLFFAEARHLVTLYYGRSV